MIDILQSVLQWFVNSVDISVTQVIMVDKDLKMLNILQVIFANCSVLLCRFHVLRYIRKKNSASFCLVRYKKSTIDNCFRFSRGYSCNVADYDAAFENLQQCNSFEFLTYFTENWHNCKTLWCLAFRRDLLTLGNNTNNRIENFNRQLKRILTPICIYLKLWCAWLMVIMR